MSVDYPVPMPPTARLEPITADNVRAVFQLAVGPAQDRFVAPNPWSLAEALAEAAIAWPRAIVAEHDGGADEIVGFLMLEIDPAEESGRPFWLWRLMIGADHQRRGYGAAAVRLAIDEVKRRGGTELYTSWVPDPEGPGAFYERLGFVLTGEVDDEEVVARVVL